MKNLSKNSIDNILESEAQPTNTNPESQCAPQPGLKQEYPTISSLLDQSKSNAQENSGESEARLFLKAAEEIQTYNIEEERATSCLQRRARHIFLAERKEWCAYPQAVTGVTRVSLGEAAL
jgi:hypothetical protein